MKATREQQSERLRRYFREAERKYGLTEPMYRTLWTAQGGACFICRKPFKTRLPAIDHDHLTGYVRGLLCGGSYDPKTCNRLIGFFSVHALRRAVEYLTAPPAYRAIGFVKPGVAVPPGGTTLAEDAARAARYAVITEEELGIPAQRSGGQ